MVHNLDEMCGYLKKLYSPYQLQQQKETSASKDVTSSGATPFSNMKLSGESYNLKVGTQSEKCSFRPRGSFRQSSDQNHKCYEPVSILKVGTQAKSVHFDQEELLDQGRDQAHQCYDTS